MRQVLLVGWLLVPALLAQTNPLAGDAAAIDVGKGNFRLYCAPCHGIHAEGGRGPDLTRGSFGAGDSDADLFRVIGRGVSGTEMAGYAERFDDAMIWRFVAFIRASAKSTQTAVPGDAKHGRDIFRNKAGCGGCHATDEKGVGGIGPPLIRIGRMRSLEYLREKLIDPSTTISPGYNTITVTLRDGTKVSGIEKGFDDFSAQLLDVNRKFHSYRREDVTSIVREKRSLMPDDYGRRLTTAEQTDLLAYLMTLRGEK